MKALIVGGGSGGHITPAVAVVRKLLELKPRTKLEFWTDRKYYKNVVKITTGIGVSWGQEEGKSGRKNPYIRVRKLASGKFRRYAGWKLKDYFKNWRFTLKELVFKNILGFFGFVGGVLQSFFRLLSKEARPDVIFLKGGFVGLPVGMVARWFKIPYVVHESDVVPGLANRLLMKKARVVAMGISFEEDEKQDNWEWVGIPVATEFKKVSEARQKNLKKTLGFDEERPLVMFTGGSQGSEHLNQAVREILPEVLKFASVGVVAGRKHYEEMTDLKKHETWDKAKLKSNFRMWEFSSAMNELMGAADVMVSRAGATTIAEMAALRKAVILIPFEKLPGAHQVKNAERLVKKQAAVAISDAEMVKSPEKLLAEIRSLVRSPKRREELAENLHKESKAGAAKRLAEILIEVSV